MRRRAARSGKGGRERKAESRERQLFFVEGERTAFSVRKSARCFSLHNGQGQRNGAAAAAARDVRNGARSGNTDKGIEKGGGEGEKGEKILSHLVRLPKKKHGPVRGGERGPTRPTRAGSAWRGKVSVPPLDSCVGVSSKKSMHTGKTHTGCGAERREGGRGLRADQPLSLRLVSPPRPRGKRRQPLKVPPG